MQHLHYDFQLNSGDRVVVSLDKQANVRLMDSSNYQNYQSGRKFTFYGGRVLKSPFTLRAPSQGHWHVAIDLGGNAGRVNAGVQVMR